MFQCTKYDHIIIDVKKLKEAFISISNKYPEYVNNKKIKKVINVLDTINAKEVKLQDLREYIINSNETEVISCMYSIDTNLLAITSSLIPIGAYQ